MLVRQSSKIELSELKLIIKPKNQDIVNIKLNLPVILNYLYILNNPLNQEDDKRKESYELTYKYGICELDNGNISFDTDDNECFNIVCAYLNTKEIDFELTHLKLDQTVTSEEINKSTKEKIKNINKFNFKYDESSLENINSLISFEFVNSNNHNVSTNNFEDELFNFIVITHENLIESYKTIVYEDLQEELMIETSFY